MTKTLDARVAVNHCKTLAPQLNRNTNADFHFFVRAILYYAIMCCVAPFSNCFLSDCTAVLALGTIPLGYSTPLLGAISHPLDRTVPPQFACSLSIVLFVKAYLSEIRGILNLLLPNQLII